MEERLLLFQLAKERYALDLQEVAEVMEPPPSYPIPRAPRHFVGLINFHGSPTTLVDLGCFLGQGLRARGQGKVLVLDARLANLALWVDSVSSVLPGASIAERAPGEDPLTRELLVTELGPARLLKVEELLDRLEESLTGVA